MGSFRRISLLILLFFPLFGWTVSRYKITTEHFIFIFEKDNEVWAQEIASFAEEVYENLSSLLENCPPQIKAVIHSDVDMANGSFYPVPEYLNLYITSPRDFFLGAKTENWLRSLFTHELTHYLSISYESGWLYEMSKFFGPILRPGAAVFQPGWVLEGITTYNETRFTQGGRGRNPYFEMIYRAQILENSMPSLKQAAYSPYIQPYGRIYVQGYMLVEYLFRCYGDDVMARFYRQMGKNPFAPYKAIKVVTGKSAEEVYRDMIREYTERFAPLNQLPVGARFSRENHVDYGRPIPTRNGIVAFKAASPKNPAQFVLIDSNTAKEQLIAFASLTGNNDYNARFEGDAILYSGYEIDSAVEGHSHYKADLFEVEVKSGKTKRLTKNARLFQPAYLDSQTAVAVQTDGPFSHLVTVDLKTGKTEILFSENRTNVYYPAVSPQGSEIAFTYNKEGFQCIAILERSSGKVELLTVENGGSLYYPAYDRNGVLFFIGDGTGSLELYEFRPDNHASVRRQLADRIAVLNGIRYGNRFFYQSYASDGYILKSESVSKALEEAVSFNLQPIEYNEDVQPVENLFTVKKYHDAAQFVGWTPFPLNYSPISGTEMPWGIGFLLYAQSAVKNDSVFLMTSFPFTVFQPSVILNTAFEWGPLNFAYSLNQGYNSILNASEELRYIQKTSQSLSISIPLFHRQAASQYWIARIDAGLTWNYLMEASVPFHFFDLGSQTEGAISKRHQLLTSQAFHFQYSWNSGFLGYPTLAPYFYGGFSSSVLLPISTQKESVYLGVLALKTQFPIAGAHSLFGEVAFSSSNAIGQSHQLLLRGFSYEDSNTTAALCGTIGYRFPIAVIDAPLFAALALHSFSGALFTQIYGNFNTQTATAAFGNYVYIGAEIAIQISFAQARFPIQVGVNCRIPTASERVFDVQSDLRPYISADIASVLAGLKTEATEVKTNEPESVRR